MKHEDYSANGTTMVSKVVDTVLQELEKMCVNVDHIATSPDKYTELVKNVQKELVKRYILVKMG